jgi:hypothetical protein
MQVAGDDFVGMRHDPAAQAKVCLSETPKQLMLAFELGKRRILQAVDQKALPATGERITLSAACL